MDMGGEEEDQDQAKAKKHFDQLEEGFELSTYQTRKKYCQISLSKLWGGQPEFLFLSGLQNFDSKNEQVVTAPNSSTGASNTISINTTGAAPTTHAVQCFVRSSKGNDRLTSKSTEAMGETKDRTFSPMVRGKNLVGGRTKLSH